MQGPAAKRVLGVVHRKLRSVVTGENSACWGRLPCDRRIADFGTAGVLLCREILRRATRLQAYFVIGTGGILLLRVVAEVQRAAIDDYSARPLAPELIPAHANVPGALLEHFAHLWLLREIGRLILRAGKVLCYPPAPERLAVVGAGGVLLLGKVPQVVLLTVDVNVAHPLALSFIPVHTLVLAALNRNHGVDLVFRRCPGRRGGVFGGGHRDGE
mmetsp:Transcript_3412/g.8911  ORF Transcript_3412/g.8911 Transcript_3412/m.8911 type:complete len:215 (-) Transcript_3412:202-846(-)